MSDLPLKEQIARLIDPSSWSVLDGYLSDMKRKYRSDHIGYDADAFKHKGSLKTADEILVLIDRASKSESPNV